MFHPSVFGHEQIASEAHIDTVQAIPALAVLAPHPNAQLQAGRQEESPTRCSTEVNGNEKHHPLTINIRNVKGDVSFALTCDGSWRLSQLRDAVLKEAPLGFARPGAVCVLAFQGKFLGDGPEPISALGLADGAQLIAVIRAPSNQTSVSATAAAVSASS